MRDERSDRVREVWTEDQLDEVLTDLAAATPVEGTEAALAAARERVARAAHDAGGEVPAEPVEPAALADPTVARTTKRSRWRSKSTAAAGLVAAVAAGILWTSGVVVLDGGEGSDSPAPPHSARAAEVLNAAASAAATSDDDWVGPGEYLYVDERGWYSDESPQHFAIRENRYETWIPATFTDVWMMRSAETGRTKWLIGDERLADQVGISTEPSVQEERAVCGDFDLDGSPSCDDVFPAGWTWPRPGWAASLPTDPDALYEKLRDDVSTWPEDDAGLEEDMFSAATQALMSGMLPPDVRAALYQVMADIPGVRLTDDAADLAGRKGVAFTLGSDDRYRQEIILDPKTGEFIGERDVLTKEFRGLEPGTVVAYTAMRTAVVDEMGQRP